MIFQTLLLVSFIYPNLAKEIKVVANYKPFEETTAEINPEDNVKMFNGTVCSAWRSRIIYYCGEVNTFHYGAEGLTTELDKPLPITSEDCEDMVKRNIFHYMGRSLSFQADTGFFIEDFFSKGKFYQNGDCQGVQFMLGDRVYLNHLLREIIQIEMKSR